MTRQKGGVAAGAKANSEIHIMHTTGAMPYPRSRSATGRATAIGALPFVFNANAGAVEVERVGVGTTLRNTWRSIDPANSER